MFPFRSLGVEGINALVRTVDSRWAPSGDWTKTPDRVLLIEIVKRLGLQIRNPSLGVFVTSAFVSDTHVAR
jgi:hypothetical protein